ncbi:MAG: dipeptidase [Opitutaceae bacterium]|nr:dipeptidase [Opitutaceae bacterium]
MVFVSARVLLQPAVAGTAADVHRRALVLDTHFDSAVNLARPGWDVMQRHTWEKDFSQVDYPRLLEGGVDGGFWAIYVGQGARTPEGHATARDNALGIAVKIREMVARNHEHFEIALRSEDAARIAATGKQFVFISMENAYPIGRDLTLVRTFYNLGVRLLGPVHLRNNEMADSATDVDGPEHGGLSELGRQLVKECNRLGIVLDASHASDQVLRDLLKLSETPVLLSHSGCKAVYSHPRNIDDDLLRALAAKGGVIQVNAFSAYVAQVGTDPERNRAIGALITSFGGRSGINTPERLTSYLAARADLERRFPMARASFDQYMAHVLHALKVAGPDHVGFSGDYDGGGGVDGLMDVTGLPKITERLLAAGYTESDIGKFWSGNALRVLKAAEDHAAGLAANHQPR